MNESLLTVAMAVAVTLGFVLGVFVTLRITAAELRYLRDQLREREDHMRRMDRVDRRLPETVPEPAPTPEGIPEDMLRYITMWGDEVIQEQMASEMRQARKNGAVSWDMLREQYHLAYGYMLSREVPDLTES